MPHDVFISHSTEDKLVALAVCNKLESAGVRCWMAPRDVGPGAEWGKAIVDAISGCRLMVLVFSSKANESSHIRREVQTAFGKDLTVIPFRVENTHPTGTMEYYLNSVHWLDALTPPVEGHLVTLVERVKTLLRAPTMESAAPSAPKPPAGPEPVARPVPVVNPAAQQAGPESRVAEVSPARPVAVPAEATRPAAVPAASLAVIQNVTKGRRLNIIASFVSIALLLIFRFVAPNWGWFRHLEANDDHLIIVALVLVGYLVFAVVVARRYRGIPGGILLTTVATLVLLGIVIINFFIWRIWYSGRSLTPDSPEAPQIVSTLLVILGYVVFLWTRTRRRSPL